MLREMIEQEIKKLIIGDDKKSSDWKIDESLEGKKTIVILQRGWVVVGDYYQGEFENKLLNASVIRKWGTTKGLGELALSGPLANTVLDECGAVRFNPGAEVCRMDCNLEKWN